MNQPRTSPARVTLRGGAWLLFGDGLYVPTALVISVFLARRLGPSQYGVFALAATAIGWLEWLIGSLFSRAAVRQLAAARDWRPVASAVVRTMLVAGVVAGALLGAFAVPAGALLGERTLVPLLYLVALNAPILGLALGYRFVLAGLERFRARAIASGLRWIGRLALVLVLVEAGLGVTGAVAATVGAAALELVVAWCFVRPPLVWAGPTPWRELTRLAAPIFLAGVSVQVFARVDLICVQVIGWGTAGTGLYGAAQSLAALPGFITTAFTPALLASLTTLVAAGDRTSARTLSRHAIRGVLWLVPVAAAVAATSGVIVRLLFGQDFAEAAPVLAVLSFAGLPTVMLVVITTLLVAYDRPWVSVAVTAPLVPLAVVGHIVAIPRLGGLGAAIVTAAVSLVVAAIAVVALKRLPGVGPFGATGEATPR